MNTAELEPEQIPKAIVNWLYAEFLNQGNPGIAIYRIEDGKIAEAWSQMDRLGVLRQIGALSPIAQGSPDQAEISRPA